MFKIYTLKTLALTTCLFSTFLTLSADNLLDTTSLDFQVINCGDAIAGNTVDAENDLGNSAYGDCTTPPGKVFNAGDHLYRFELDQDTVVSIYLSMQSDTDLDVFLLGNDTVNEIECPGGCIAAGTEVGNDLIQTELSAGIYWIVVEGDFNPGPPQVVQEGAYVLSLACGKDYEMISCGESKSGSTVGRQSLYGSNGSGSYDDCFDGIAVPVFGSGDRLYRLDLAQDDTVTITLQSTTLADLDIFLMNNQVDEELGDCPGSCQATTRTIPGKIIGANLTAGTYWIIVDGIEVLANPMNILQEGPYVLSVECGTKDFIEAEIDSSYQNTTVGKVNSYDNQDYAGCIDSVGKIYGAADQLYRLVLTDSFEVTLNLTSHMEDLDLFLFDNDSANDCPGNCLAKSSNEGLDNDQINMNLLAGTYWISIDGALNIGLPTTFDEGSFTLNVMGTALPVQLTRFEGHPNNQEVHLEWTTASEVGSEEFVVQRSTDALSWMDLGTVAAQGFSTEVINYLHVDRQPAVGNNFYRLKMLDLDGSFEYSSVVNVPFRSGEDIRVYPNVSQNQITVDFGSQSPGRFHIIDAYGKVWRTVVTEDVRAEVDISNLSSGMYYLHFEDQAKALPIIKQ